MSADLLSQLPKTLGEASRPERELGGRLRPVNEIVRVLKDVLKPRVAEARQRPARSTPIEKVRP